MGRLARMIAQCSLELLEIYRTHEPVRQVLVNVVVLTGFVLEGHEACGEGSKQLPFLHCSYLSSSAMHKDIQCHSSKESVLVSSMYCTTT